MDTLPVVSGKFPQQLSKSTSKAKDDASLRTGLLPPPKGSGFPPKLCWRYFYEAIKEIVRITHAKRIYEYLDLDFGGKTISNILMLDEKYPYAEDVAKICVGHGEDYDYVKALRNDCTKGRYNYNPQYLTVLLRIADYLDLDKQRTPILWYKIMRIDGFSRDEWEKHFIIHNEKKLKQYNNKMQIFFEGTSANANIHRKYLKYIDELKLELENADETLNTKESKEQYAFNVITKVDDCVSTEGFKYSDLRLNLDYSSITELLMGKNIYGDTRLGLRELIQNSIDACKIMREIKEENENIDYYVEPQVFVIISKEKGYVKIKDTGIGMTLDVVKKHFLNVGKSYYKSNEYAYQNFAYKPIGQFGIGFLACFLLSDNVIVKTKHYQTNEINQIELVRNSEYVVTNTEETGTFFGTEITLDYEKFFSVFSSIANVKEFLERYFYSDIPITLKNEDEKQTFVITNSCRSAINNKLEKDTSGTKYEDVICENYSSVIEGELKLQSIPRKKSFDVNLLSDLTYYCYDPSSTTFKKALPFPDGYYIVIEYYKLDENQYRAISKSKKSLRNKRTELVAAATEKVFLVMGRGHVLDYIEIDGSEDLHLAIDGIPIKQIVQASGLEVYEELLNDYGFSSPIFKAGDHFICLQACYFDANDRHRFDDGEKLALGFYFYHKGVYIRGFNFVPCQIPFALNGLGYINYKGNNIKLDVSRNNVIENNGKIALELTNIILKYMLEKRAGQTLNSIIEAMIAHNTALMDEGKS